jgi:hypothetical protein
MPDPIFPFGPRRAVALLMIGACIGATAVAWLFILLGLVRHVP